MTETLFVGIVAAASAVAGAAVAGFFTLKATRKATESAQKLAQQQQSHERLIERQRRSFDRRADAYVDVIRAVQHHLHRIALTYPVFDEGTKAPEPPSLEETLQNHARIAAFGSQKVRELLKGWEGKTREFWADAHYLHDTKLEEEKYGRQALREQNVSLTDIYRSLENHRRALGDMAIQIEQRMATELSGEY